MTLHEVRRYLDRMRAFHDDTQRQRPEMLRVLEAAEDGWSRDSAKVSELILELQELRAWRQKVVATVLGADVAEHP
jgi:DNA-binding ferritin-like protein (Dps family)